MVNQSSCTPGENGSVARLCAGTSKMYGLSTQPHANVSEDRRHHGSVLAMPVFNIRSQRGFRSEDTRAESAE